jgi:cytidine deaminase
LHGGYVWLKIGSSVGRTPWLFRTSAPGNFLRLYRGCDVPRVPMQKKPNQKTISKPLFAKLRAAAMTAARQAYCPYSHFPVGAAVLTTDGRIFLGCNVENASYGLTSCAERNAIFRAVACGSKQVVMVMIYTPTANPSAPCGACRQVINEFGADAKIHCVCDGPEELQVSLAELLKHAFGPKNLG